MNFMKHLIAFFSLTLLFSSSLLAQNDSSRTKELKEVFIKAWQRSDVSRLPDVQNNIIVVGKKNEVITLAGTNANIAIKTGRQLFSKVPGVFVYDMDGSGNQVNISTRGLDPHRSWEFNLRQNGVLINSDMYGYPASHYSAPMESYERVEIIRGTGSLQYGAQFGGLINYVTKKPDTTTRLSLESINTAGSFGLLSSYSAIGGTINKFSYYAYYYRRHSKGYRKNSESDADAAFVQLQYRFSDKLNLKGEIGRSKYLYRIPGPLNDSMFQANPKSSTRSRNYFSPDIYVPSLSLDWKVSKNGKLGFIISGVFGERNSVMLDALATVPDIDPMTGNYKNRQVDRDHFSSRTAEARYLQDYSLGKTKAKLAAGIVYMNNDLHRRQLGKGTRGSDYDLSLIENFRRDLHFKTGNIAFYAENVFQFTHKWSVSLGARTEKGSSEMSGKINYYNNENLPNHIDHHFFLPGISSQYNLGEAYNFYGGISKAYRPVIFKDIIPASTYEQVDKDLKNAFGYNAEIGMRGKLAKHFQYDISLFQLQYNNRMGSLVLNDASSGSYIYRTNVGDSRSRGIELFTQYRFALSNYFFVGLFSSSAYTDARYTKGAVAAGGVNKNITGNKVEAVPEWNSRNGLDILYKGFSGTLLYSYTSSSFSDPLNTVQPPVDGSKGFTPAYSVWDFNISLRLNDIVSFRSGVNNIFNKKYFTKRPTFYPGPGIWPSDGRNGYITVALNVK